MSGKFSWTVATPDGPVASGECEFLVVPTTGGELGVMADHAALVACVAPGELRVSAADGARTISVEGGIVDVRDNTVLLLVARAEKRPAEKAAGAPN
jgi:F-type H+-transporting ATPase subunit epsilon